MSKASELAVEVRAYCIANQDPQKAQAYTRYFKEGYDAWGIDKNDPLWTTKQQEWMERYRALGLCGFFQAGELLFTSGKYEEGSMAIRFIKALRDQIGENEVPALAGYFRAGIRNWAHTDVFCAEVITPLLAEGRIPLDALAGWRASDLKYQRRAVPVAMLGLIKTQPVAPLVEFIRPLMMDEERVVHHGLGWFLREAWKKNSKPVEAFLREWKNSSARLIFQYATEKMTPAARAKFRRAEAAGAK